MKNQKDPGKPSRRKFAKSAVTALALAPFASLPSRGKGGVQDRPRLLQSSPITVGGGGSVGIDFKDPISGDFLHKLWLIDKYGALEDITPTPTEKCVVKILCKKGTKERTITITGKPLSIDFDPVEFKRGKPPGGKKEIHHNKDYKIVKIEAGVIGQPLTAYDAPTEGKCTVVVVNSL